MSLEEYHQGRRRASTRKGGRHSVLSEGSAMFVGFSVIILVVLALAVLELRKRRIDARRGA